MAGSQSDLTPDSPAIRRSGPDPVDVRRRRHPSLRVRLAATSCAVILVIGALAAVWSFLSAFGEARQLQDDVLRQVAMLVRSAPTTPENLASTTRADDRASDIVIQALGLVETGEVAPDFPRTLGDGLHTVRTDGQDRRVLVRTLPTGGRVAVSQSVAVRDEIARESALASTAPLLVLTPVLVLLTILVTRWALAPIPRLTDDLAARDAGELRPVPTAGAPRELVGFLSALNEMLGRAGAVLDGQRRFAAEAAHELRTPVAAVTLQAEHLATARTPHQQAERLARMRSGLARMQRLCDQLLTLGEAGSTAPEPVVALGEALAPLIPEWSDQAGARAIDLSVTIEPAAWVQVPQTTIQIAVRNLVDNAIRYAAPAGHVSVSAVAAESGLVLTVDDDGPGIVDPDAVLEPFHREVGQEIPGAGLGLAITRQVLARAGGTLVLHDTRRFTRGTCAEVRLPPSID